MTTAAPYAVIPASHADLIDRPLPAVLTTQLPDGRLQSTVVWYDHDGDHLLINTMREFQKARNLRGRPLATVLIVEPRDANRWIEVRARVVPDGRDPRAHLDTLGRRYTGVSPYFGRVVPAGLAEVEHPVLYRLIPVAVRTGPMYTRGRLARSTPGHDAGPAARGLPRRARHPRVSPGPAGSAADGGAEHPDAQSQCPDPARVVQRRRQ